MKDCKASKYFKCNLFLLQFLLAAMNGATSGAKAGTALSSKDEHGPGAPNIERPSVIEDARLYPEVGHLSVQPPVLPSPLLVKPSWILAWLLWHGFPAIACT